MSVRWLAAPPDIRKQKRERKGCWKYTKKAEYGYRGGLESANTICVKIRISHGQSPPSALLGKL